MHREEDVIRAAVVQGVPRTLHNMTHLLRARRSEVALAALSCLTAAVVVQARLVDAASPELSRYLLIICVLGLAAAVLIATVVSTDASAEETAMPASLPLLPTGVAGLLGIGCALYSAHLEGSDLWDGQWWWLLAMALPLVGLVAASLRRRPSFWSPLRALGRLEVAGMLVLLAAALAVRLPLLTESPPWMHGDEASCGLYGRVFDAGHTPLLSISWFGLPMLSYAISGVGLHLFGDNLVGLRTINAVIGSLSVVLLYLLGKEWFGRRAGALAAIFLCFAFLHAELSRDGIHYLQGPTCITLTLYLCTLWLKRGGMLAAFLTGISIAIDVQVYWSARIAPLLVAGLLVFLLVRRPRLLLARRLELAWMVIGALVSGLPVAALFAANPGDFNGHQNQVSIFSNDPGTQQHLLGEYGHVSTLTIALRQGWHMLATFNAWPDSSLLFGPWQHGLLDTVTAALLPAALILATLRWKRWPYAVVLAWFWSVVVAGALTLDPPIWPRTVSVVPAVALLVGVLVADLWSVAESGGLRRPAALGALAVVLGLMAFKNVHAVFVDYPDVARQTSMEATYLGRFLATAPGASHTVLLSDGSLYVNYETVQFLAPHASGCTLLPGQAESTCPIFGNSRLFVLLPGRVGDLSSLERRYPGGHVVKVGTYSYGSAQILAYELPGTT